MKKIVVIDNEQCWIDKGIAILTELGYKAIGILVNTKLTSMELPADIAKKIKEAHGILMDKNLGGHSSSRLICAIKGKFPIKTMVRWTEGDHRAEEYILGGMGIYFLSKPVNEEEEKIFSKKLATCLGSRRRRAHIQERAVKAFNLACEGEDQARKYLENHLLPVADGGEIKSAVRHDFYILELLTTPEKERFSAKILKAIARMDAAENGTRFSEMWEAMNK